MWSFASLLYHFVLTICHASCVQSEKYKAIDKERKELSTLHATLKQNFDEVSERATTLHQQLTTSEQQRQDKEKRLAVVEATLQTKSDECDIAVQERDSVQKQLQQALRHLEQTTSNLSKTKQQYNEEVGVR